MRSISTVLSCLLSCATIACGTVATQEEPDAGPGDNPNGPGDKPGGNPDDKPGEGPGAGLAFGDPTYDFGDMTVGQAGLPFSTRIVNKGDAPIGPLAVKVTGEHTDDFVVDTKACASITLGAGSDCTVTISFAP